MTALLVTIVALPFVGALAARSAGDVRGAARIGAAVAGASFALALALTVHVAVSGPVGVTVAGEPVLYADRVGAVLLLLVSGVSAVVQGFAGRYLLGDLRAVRFFAATGLLTGATAAMVTAATLVGLALAWTAAGAALCLLLGLYRGLPAAGEGVRRTVRAFAIGDGALWLGVVIALLAWGNPDLRSLGTVAAADPGDEVALAVVSCLLVVAAVGRSAQLPLQRWLPATLAAPTPVSALLHAGVINGGGILLVRTSALFGASAWATHFAFAIGAATTVYGTALMLTKPDIKGALAHSTMGQMGFMVMTCGLGAFAAAAFHLVAHGMYKASLFLGSGGAVQRRRAEAAGELSIVDGLLRYRLPDGSALDDVEAATQLLCIFIGGTETVPKIVAHGLRELAGRPDQLAAVRADPGARVPQACDEMIRYCAPAQWFARTARKPYTLHDTTIEPGQRIITLLASASRDERQYPDPDSFVWDRPIKRSLAFGRGQHFCIGYHLARLEVTVLVQEWLRRVGEYRIVTDDATRLPSSFQWGWNNIPVEV